MVIFSQNKNKNNDRLNSIQLDNDNFDVVEKFNYLGHMLHECLDDELDVKEKLNSFHISFNSVFRNFNQLSLQVLLNLFNAYCIPSYGVSLWSSSNLFSKQ